MSNDLMIPNMAEVPSYILNPELARQANADAAAGISTGFPARIKLSQKSFIMVDSAGEEKSYPASKLVLHDEQQYLPIVVIKPKMALSKVWYATAFNPSEEGKQPDCFSHDALRPDPSALVPQSDTCAACPQNQFGSGKDQAGNPSKGKACSDSKILAVFVAGFGVNMLKIPPDSLKNFGVYVKQLSAAGIPISNVKTMIGFDPTVTTPRLVFKFGGFLPETMLPKVSELQHSVETAEIVGGTAVALPPPPAGTPALTQGPVLPDSALADIAAAEAMAKAAAEAKVLIDAKIKADAEAEAKKAAAEAKKQAAALKAAEAAKKAAATPAGMDFDMDMGMDGTASMSAAPPAPPAAPSAGGVSDDDLMKELGL